MTEGMQGVESFFGNHGQHMFALCHRAAITQRLHRSRRRSRNTFKMATKESLAVQIVEGQTNMSRKVYTAQHLLQKSSCAVKGSSGQTEYKFNRVIA